MLGLEHKLAHAARKAGLITASAALTLVGAGFLTAALWLYLSAEQSPLFAAVVIGCGYFGAGILALAVASSRGRRHYHPPQESISPMLLVALSFLQGLEQGKKARDP